MADFGIAEAAAILGALASAGTAAYTISRGAAGGGKMPTPQPMDTTQLSKALLPGAKADAAARVGGGLSPDFLAGLIGQQTGTPSGGTDILQEIRNSLGGQAP